MEIIDLGPLITKMDGTRVGREVGPGVGIGTTRGSRRNLLSVHGTRLPQILQVLFVDGTVQEHLAERGFSAEILLQDFKTELEHHCVDLMYPALLRTSTRGGTINIRTILCVVGEGEVLTEAGEDFKVLHLEDEASIATDLKVSSRVSLENLYRILHSRRRDGGTKIKSGEVTEED